MGRSKDTDENSSAALLATGMGINKVSPYLASLPTFEGNTDGVDIFFERLGRIGEYAEWSENDKVFALSLKLGGEAARFYRENLVTKGLRDFSGIKEALEERFKHKELAHDCMRRFVHSFQRPRESAREFASRIEALSFKAMPEGLRSSPAGEDSRKETLVSVFLEGLRPQLKRLVIPHNHKTFEAALRHATMEEEIYESHADTELDQGSNHLINVAQATSISNADKIIKAQQDMIEKLAKAVEKLTDRVEELSINHPTGNSNFSPRTRANAPRCWRCNRRGHVQRNCRIVWSPRENGANIEQGLGVYHPGETADYFSRAVNVVVVAETAVEPSLLSRIKNRQSEDYKCNKLRELIAGGVSPNPKSLIFFEKEGTLWCTPRNPKSRKERVDKLVVPGELTQEVIKLCHSDPTSAHPGLARTLYRIKKHYYWPGMYIEIRKFVLSCHSCISQRGHIRNPPAPCQRIPIAERPLQRVQPSKLRNKCVKGNLRRAAERQEKERGKFSKEKGIGVGDLVYCHFPNVGRNVCRKFAHKNRGPYRVIKQTSPVNFQVELIESPQTKISVHVDRLRKLPCPGVEEETKEEGSGRLGVVSPVDGEN